MDHLETAEYTYWVGKDGILRVRFTPGTAVSLNLITRCYNDGLKFIGDDPRSFLVFIDNVKRMDRSARAFVSEMQMVKAGAVVASSPIARIIGAMVIALSTRAPFPLRLFSTEKEAVKWLQEHQS